ncbi:MAG TPA: phosphoenolpyruvate mutase [Gemmatimonadaceae bacterium]|nr:phosphoenolpyruvate mutase [Gemmatimonadaceae bacterium]
MKKTTQLRAMLQSPDLDFIIEAHNGLSARIAEEAGFKGIWGSGLSISAALGVRDNNEASWTQVLEVLEFMSDVTTIPILLDGDTGYGNFNNLRRLVSKLEQRDIAGVCIEDKRFPKTNSFIGDAQPLADMDEFCGKIKAAKDTQKDEDFVVVARLEGFIAGRGLKDVLTRAEAYHSAGADALLVHSKKSNPSDIDAFMAEWDKRLPIVIVPTKYYSTPTEHFRELGISLAIWANHNVRASIQAMRVTTARIFADKSLINVEGTIATVGDIFHLQGADELESAEQKYLPTSGKRYNVVVLAASQGEKFGDLTRDIPKTLLKANGVPILTSQLNSFNRMGITDVTVVRGFAREAIILPGIKTVDNDEYAATKELYSLYVARDSIKGNTVISYGDILFKDHILHELINSESDISIVVDADWNLDESYTDLVQADKPYSRSAFSEPVMLRKMSSTLPREMVSGEFIGLWKVNQRGAAIVKTTLECMSRQENFKSLRMADLFTELAGQTIVSVIYTRGAWMDVDSIVDLTRASELQ